MLRRTLIALLLIPVFGLLLQSLPWVLGLVALVHVLAQLELASLIEGLGRTGRVVHTLFSTVLMCWCALQLLEAQPANLLLGLLLAIIGYLIISLRLALRGGDPDSSWLLVRGIALISLPLAFLP